MTSHWPRAAPSRGPGLQSREDVIVDLSKIRADTPATKQCAYLHNAGAALMPCPVVKALKDHIDLEAEIGGYAAARREGRRCEAVYDSVARLLNASREEIALVENATVAWQMAFYSIAFAPGDRILTAEAEYAANYVAFSASGETHGCGDRCRAERCDG